MGIKGLLNIIKPLLDKKHLSEFKNKRMAIDGLSWIYRGFYGMIYDNKPQIEKTLFFISKMIQMFNHLEIKIIVVLDGRSWEVKNETKSIRNDKRKYYNNKKEKCKKNTFEKQKFEDLSNKIDKDTINSVIEYLKKLKIEYIIAPYEADAQMVYLQKNKMVDYLVSEDSDLILYGGNNILFKLNNFGECEHLDLKKKFDYKLLKNNQTISNFLKMSLEEKILMSILSGCDYTSGIKGIGIINAIKIVKKFFKKELEIKEIFNIIIKKKNIEKELFDKIHFDSIYLIFNKQLIFDPKKKKMMRFDNTSEIDIQNLCNKNKYKYIGKFIDNGKEFVNYITDNNSNKQKKNKLNFNINDIFNKTKDESFKNNIKRALENGKFSIEREREIINKNNKKKLKKNKNLYVKNNEEADVSQLKNLNNIFEKSIFNNDEKNINNNLSIIPKDNIFNKNHSEMTTPSNLTDFNEKKNESDIKLAYLSPVNIN